MFVWALLGAPPSFAQSERPELPKAFVWATVDTLAAVVKKEYVDSTAGNLIAASLLQRLAMGKYARIPDEQTLSKVLTRDLYIASHDKHLGVMVDRQARTTPAKTSKEGDGLRREDQARRSNFGIQRAEILPGNVGYLNVTWFYRRDEARDVVGSAMHFLRNADALILDLRNNGGGSPDMVALFMSYLTGSAHQEMFAIVGRDGTRLGFATDDSLPIEHDARRPLFVLTSRGTFSAGEGLAYLIQERGRGLIVGEVTAGAANPGRPYRLNEDLAVTVPNGRVVTAVRSSNWEGKGVVPDIRSSAQAALDTARVRAVRSLEKE
jgi:C-terminal processing protease CtpA/Prc